MSPSLDFRRSTDSDFSLDGVDAEFGDIVLTAVRDKFRVESPFTVGPLMPDGPRIQIRTYFEVGPLNLMALFVDAPVGNPPPTPPAVRRMLFGSTNVAVLVPNEIIDPELQRALDLPLKSAWTAVFSMGEGRA